VSNKTFRSLEDAKLFSSYVA